MNAVKKDKPAPEPKKPGLDVAKFIGSLEKNAIDKLTEEIERCAKVGKGIPERLVFARTTLENTVNHLKYLV